jgi:serine/threonine protein kinase
MSAAVREASCPDDNVVARIVSGEANADERAHFEVHVDTCARCAELVAEIARTWFDDATRADSTVVDAAPPSMDAMEKGLGVGAKVGRYVLGPKIGAGGMGTVHVAYDPVLRRSIALKILQRVSGDADDEERWLREARAMARVAHPNVVTVHDAGRTDDGRVFIALELVRGPSLRRWLRAHPALPWRSIVDLFVQAARGLQAAHDAGVVHRDFKPENVLVEPSDRPRVRVTDFGLARASRVAPANVDVAPHSLGGAAWRAERSLPETGAVGTPAYMSPEQLDAHATDARTDQWSFGLALHEALFGARPFTGATLDERRAAMRKFPVFPRSPSVSSVPTWVCWIVARALRERPDQRFATMTAVVDALERGEGKSAEWILALHVLGLVAMACVHIVFTALVAFALVQPDNPNDVSAYGRFDAFVSALFGMLLVTGWLPLGIPVTLAGAWGVAKRKAWAYVVVTLYAFLSLFTVVGTPYALFALATLLRADVRAALGRKMR